MLRSVYLAGVAYIALCAYAVSQSRRPAVSGPDHPIAIHQPQTAELPPGDAAGWFAGIKPFCNTVEAETALRQRPAPAGRDGTGYQAACLALAGKIDQARGLLAALAGDDQWRAAGIVFEVAHPVADAGDDRSAGPIMAMVTDFWPNHYMALYHAGVSEVALGDLGSARRHLEAFLRTYQVEDGWRSNAMATLDRIGQ